LEEQHPVYFKFFERVLQDKGTLASTGLKSSR